MRHWFFNDELFIIICLALFVAGWSVIEGIRKHHHAAEVTRALDTVEGAR